MWKAKHKPTLQSMKIKPKERTLFKTPILYTIPRFESRGKQSLTHHKRKEPVSPWFRSEVKGDRIVIPVVPTGSGIFAPSSDRPVIES